MPGSPTKRLGDVVSLQRGISWDAADERDRPGPGVYPVLRIPNVQRERLVLADILHVRVRSVAMVEPYRADPGTILLVGSNGNPERVGNAAFVESDQGFLYASFLMGARLRPGADEDARFLYHFISSPGVQDALTRSVQGTTGLKNLSESTVTELRYLDVPRGEQSRIAAVLDTIDEAIRRTEQVIAKLQQMKQGLLHDLLTRGVGEHGYLRPPPHEAPHLYKNSPLGWIPKVWEATELGNLLSLIYRYPTYYDIDYVTEGVPEVRGELLQSDGTLSPDQSVYRSIAPMTASRFPRVRLEAGDFVMTVRGTVGKIAEVPGWLAGGVITANLIRMVFDKARIHVGWMKCYLLSNFFQDALDLACSATTIKTVQVPALSSIRLRVPSTAEQGICAQRVAELDANIRHESNAVQKLRTLKHGLLHDLLTGRVRVPMSAKVVR